MREGSKRRVAGGGATSVSDVFRRAQPTAASSSLFAQDRRQVVLTRSIGQKVEKLKDLLETAIAAAVQMIGRNRR
jgi:hypothetical protein